MKVLVFIIIASCNFNFLSANNLKIENFKLLNFNALEFKISWENTWNYSAQTPYNHDAVWVFFKYKNDMGVWKHLNLKPQNKRKADVLLEFFTSKDNKGIFVKLSKTGSYKTFESETIQIFFSQPNDKISELAVFGIEMIYVPEGAFFVGDSASYYTLRKGNVNRSFLISSEKEINVGEGENEIQANNQTFDFQKIPAAFPKGYDAFYCMKYEISQAQFADFLNTLTFEQQVNQTFNPPNSQINTPALFTETANRNAIVIEMSGIEKSKPARYACNANFNTIFDDLEDAQFRSVNWLNWLNLAAYLDWAALRPMTETEYEKICRGAENEPIAGEFAWGTPFINDANSAIYDGTENEQVTDIIAENCGLANHGYAGLNGALRCGFAAKTQTTRLEAGAAFYGAMEMSGNLWELVVVLNNKGVTFNGENGDGEIAENGEANVESWANNTTAEGIGYKGGAWSSGIFPIGSFRDLAVSDRYYINLNADLRRNTAGGRGVRKF